MGICCHCLLEEDVQLITFLLKSVELQLVLVGVLLVRAHAVAAGVEDALLLRLHCDHLPRPLPRLQLLQPLDVRPIGALRAPLQRQVPPRLAPQVVHGAAVGHLVPRHSAAVMMNLQVLLLMLPALLISMFVNVC